VDWRQWWALDEGQRAELTERAQRLAARGAADRLAALADDGDLQAGIALADLLVERGEFDQLAARVEAGDRWASHAWIELVDRRGDLVELARLADAGHAQARARLSMRLTERGDLDALAARAAAGDSQAHTKLLALLEQRGDLDELARLAEAGDEYAANRLAVRRLLAKDDLAGLRELADRAVDWHTRAAFAKLLADRGEYDELVELARRDNPAKHELGRLRSRGLES
jgi:hypothetical protein